MKTTLNWYKELHYKYGVVISCYVYYEDDNFNLSQFPSKYRGEFERNNYWLRFDSTPLMVVQTKTVIYLRIIQKTINELERIVVINQLTT